MEGEKIKFNNEFNIYQYFSQVTLQSDPSVLSKDAIIFEHDKKISFGQLSQNICNIKSFILEKLGEKYSSFDEMRNRIVGIHLAPDEFTVAILLAIHSLSMSYLPIDPLLPFERMEYIINDSDPVCLITNVQTDEKIDSIIQDRPIVLININEMKYENFISNRNKKILNERNYNAHDVAMIIYTSGSSGSPKGVCLTHFTIMNRFNWQWSEFLLESNDKGALKTSLNFGDHMSEIFCFILKGLPLYIVRPSVLSKINELIDVIYEQKITYFILVPSLLRNMILFVNATKQSFKLDSVRRWVCSGEELTVDLLEIFFDMKQKGTQNESILSNFYGSTETTADLAFVSFCSRQQMRQLLFEDKLAPIGRPIANAKFYLLDEKMAHVRGDGEVGEIYAGGDCLATGYLNNNINNERFVRLNGEMLFKTGDFGFIYKTNLYYSGRKDSQIKIRGKRVDLNDLVFFSRKIKGIEAFIPLVIDLNDQSQRRIIIAYYKPDHDIKDESDMNSYIRKELQSFIFDYMMPEHIIKLDQVPLLYNGKADKQFLIKLFKERFLNFNLKPVDLEGQIVHIIHKITGIQFLENNTENFLKKKFVELGVNSLNSIEIFLEINTLLEERGIEKIEFKQFILFENLLDIVSFIKDSKIRNVIEYSNLVSLPVKGNRELISCIYDMFIDTYEEKFIFLKNYKIDREYHFKILDLLTDLYLFTEESFIVFDKKLKKFVGGALLFDVEKNIFFEINDAYYNSINEFIEFCLQESLTLVDSKLKINFVDAVTTNKFSTFQENLIISDFIEDEIIRVSKRCGYDAIIGINTSPVTDVNFIFYFFIVFLFD